MINLLEILKRTESYFTQKGIDTPRLDAELLMAHALGCDRMGLYLSFDKPLSDAELQKIRPLVARRGTREPIAYILGEKGFHNIDLKVHPKTLCPRPDTETLVESALKWIPENQEIFVADLGCGTGAVGLAIAALRPLVKVYAVDLSSTAIECTKENTKRLGLEKRVGILKGRWMDPIPMDRPIDIVVSNPPYIPSQDIDHLEDEVSIHEPRMALDGGPDGLMHYREFIPTAAKRARLGVMVEVGSGQALDVLEIMLNAGLKDVKTQKDYGGVERVVMGRRPQNTAD